MKIQATAKKGKANNMIEKECTGENMMKKTDSAEIRDMNLFRCQGKIRAITYDRKNVEISVAVFEIKDHPVEFTATVRDPEVLIKDAINGKTVYIEGYVSNMQSGNNWYVQKFFVTKISPARKDLEEFIGNKAERVSEPFFRFYMVGTPIRLKDTGNDWTTVVMKTDKGQYVKLSAYYGGKGLKRDKIVKDVRTAVCCKANTTKRPLADGKVEKITNIVIQEAVLL